MNKPKPIALLTLPRDAFLQAEDVCRRLDEAGYLPLIVEGGHVSIRVLTPRKMGREDYRACVNAAKAMLERATK